MASFNKVLLMGNLTRKPELRYTPGGQAVCDIGLAVNRKYSGNGQDKEEVCFVDVVVWAKQAESCNKYLHKGSPVFVEGRLHYDAWEDKEGRKRSRLRVTAERVQFLSSKSDDSRQEYKAEGYNNESPNRSSQPSYSNSPENGPQHASRDTGQYFQQNHQPADRNEPMPPPPPEAFNTEAEPEDDIPF